MDKAEATKNPLCLTFIDWAKAFDRIKQNKLIEALGRMSIPEKIIKAIESLYNEPEFRVKIDGKTSEWKTQNSGIRQGCPLSPYLFNIAMTVIMRDVHDGLNLKRGTIDTIDFNELMYADDTALVTNNTNAMNRLLERIETRANSFGLHFNKDECVAMIFNISNGKTKMAL